MSHAEAVMLCRYATEHWARVPGYPSYEVSDLGRVRSWLTHRGQPGPRFLSAGADNKGYLTVRLSGEDGMRTHKVHVLVAAAFLGSRPEGAEVRHLDGDNQNNRLGNLMYGTPAENMADRVRHKTHCKQGHPFDAANTHRRPDGTRACRACLAAADKRRRLRERKARA